MFSFEIIQEHSCILSLGACLFLSILFVASLYVWNSPHDRNHPATIKKRFCSVSGVMILSLLIVKQFLIINKFENAGFLDLLGFRFSGLLPAMFIPLLLTMILFLGPLAMYNFSDLEQIFQKPSILIVCFKDLIWLRNIIVAPISEEFTFRACMMPLLLQCYQPMTSVFICSLFFGLGHVHHLLERLKAGDPINIVLIISCFEFSYTALFGAYSAFLFVKTGHFVAPLVAHSFCNIMGFPDFNKVLACKNPKKIILIFLFLAGVIFWTMLLMPLTHHSLYNNNIFWKDV